MNFYSYIYSFYHSQNHVAFRIFNEKHSQKLPQKTRSKKQIQKTGLKLPYFSIYVKITQKNAISKAPKIYFVKSYVFFIFLLKNPFFIILHYPELQNILFRTNKCILIAIKYVFGASQYILKLLNLFFCLLKTFFEFLNTFIRF